MKKKTNKTTISNLRYNLTRFALTVSLGSAVFKMNSFESLANTNDTVISLEKEAKYVSEIIYNSQNFDDAEVMQLLEYDKMLANKVDFVFKYGYDAATDTKVNTDFVLTKSNKTYEDMSQDDYRLFVAVVAAESNKTFYDAFATATCIVNRTISVDWVNYANGLGYDGKEIKDQMELPGQFTVYGDGKYVYYLNPDNVPQEVEDACRFVAFHGWTCHEFTSFLGSNALDYSDNQVVEGGNRYSGELNKLDEEKTFLEKVTDPIDSLAIDVKQKIKVVE